MVEEEKDPKERLRFAYYTRNDAFVKERFVAKDYNRASTTGLGNFDRLFGFFLGLDLFSLFDFRPEGRQRIMIPTVLLLSTYSAKIICEMSSLNQIDTQLFKDRALLEKIGFTGVQIEEGFSERSKKRHLPFNVSTLGKLMPDFSLEEINCLFSRQFALLAQKHFIPSGIFVADATPLCVSRSSKYENAGVITKDGKKYKGYKLITLKYAGPLSKKARPKPEIFVAAIVVPLNEHENKYLLPLLAQGIKNIGEGKIKMIVVDRGFVDGENLWEAKHKYKTDFLIYSKSNMDVTKELKAKLKEAKERKEKGLKTSDCIFQEDEENSVYGFNRLGWFWTYGDQNHQKEYKKKIYKKDIHFQTHPISGAIVTRYRGKKDKEITLLSSKRFSQSFTPLDALPFYRKRQQIENAGFRELKQGYKIGKFPSRKFNGVCFHIIFTLLMFNFISAFKTETGGRIAKLGLRRLHRQISLFGVILYACPHFGIFEINEVLGWTGFVGKESRSPP